MISGTDFNAAGLFAVAGASLVGVGLFIVVAHPRLLRRIIGLNVLGAGIFLIFGTIARRGAGSGFPGDPVPQGLVITGLVVAFAATALAIALLQRLFDTGDRSSTSADFAPLPPDRR